MTTFVNDPLPSSVASDLQNVQPPILSHPSKQFWQKMDCQHSAHSKHAFVSTVNVPSECAAVHAVYVCEFHFVNSNFLSLVLKI